MSSSFARSSFAVGAMSASRWHAWTAQSFSSRKIFLSNSVVSDSFQMVSTRVSCGTRPARTSITALRSDAAIMLYTQERSSSAHT